MKKSNWMAIVSGLSWLTQLGLSVAVPVVLCILGAQWLQKTFALGGWIVLVGLLVGLGAGASSFYEFCRMMHRRAKKKNRNDDEPHSFNH